MATLNDNRTLPVGDCGIHPCLWVYRSNLDIHPMVRQPHIPCGRHITSANIRNRNRVSFKRAVGVGSCRTVWVNPRRRSIVLRQVYDQMADPKWVIAMGACSSTGGMFNNYALVQGVDHIVPVDIYVPGCPPGPQSLMHGILTLHDKIMDGEINR